MNISGYFQSKTLPSLGLLLFRVAVGLAFVMHGLGKVPHAFTWMGEGTAPAFLQAAAAYSEFLGGAAFALGLASPLASLALIGVMTGALGMVHLPSGHPFVATEPNAPSYELALVYFTSAVMVLLNSPGKFSLDYLLLKFLRPAAFRHSPAHSQS